MALGKPDPRWLLKRLPPRLLAEWMEYYAMEPFGQVRGDLQAGIIAAALYDLNTDRKTRKHDPSPGDFVLSFGDEAEPERKSTDELVAALRALGESANAALASG